jgi:TonB family protein
MESDRSNNGFFFSLGLHVVVVATIVALSLWSRVEKEEPIHVFELVSLAEIEAEPTPTPAEPTPPRPEPEPEPLPPLQVNPVEDLRAPPPVNLAPIPAPTPPPPAPPPPAPAPPRQINFEDWARDRNLPDRTQRVTQRPPPAPVPAVRIQTDIRERLRSAADLRVENYEARSAVEQSAMDNYLNDIRARLRTAFDPTGRDLAAVARFQVDATGRITQVDIVQSSGNRAFDQSVRATFDRIGRFPAPPSGRAHTWTTTFRSTDQ